MRWAVLGISGVCIGQIPQPTEALYNPFAPPPDIVARLKQRVSEEAPERLFKEDLYYPNFFAGTWKTESTLLSVACPAGYKLFGRTGSFEEAKKNLGVPLGKTFKPTQGIGESVQYDSRFVRSMGNVIADRAFNVASIARATMGPYSVLDCETKGNRADQLQLTLKPGGVDGSVFAVDLKTIGRTQQNDYVPRNIEAAFKVREEATWTDIDAKAQDISREGLYTSETIRQEVRLNTDDLRIQPSIKHVETTTVFLWDDDTSDYFRAWQKTSTYLTRSNLQYVDARGRAVDVRWYEVQYSRE